MPYGNPPEYTARIERCVARLTAGGRSKVSSIKICKASIMKAGKVRKHLAKS